MSKHAKVSQKPEKTVVSSNTTKQGPRKKAFGKIIAIVIGVGLLLLIIISAVHANTSAKRRNALIEEYATLQQDAKAKTSALKSTFEKYAEDAGLKSTFDTDAAFSACVKTLGYEQLPSVAVGAGAKDASISKLEKMVQGRKAVVSDLGTIEERLEECKPQLVEAAEQQKRQEEETARKAAEAKERAKAMEGARMQSELTYSKFVNQIKDGMTIDQIQQVFDFKGQCSLASDSGTYTSYSCDLTSNGKYRHAIFVFYNGKLQSKNQYGL